MTRSDMERIEELEQSISKKLYELRCEAIDEENNPHELRNWASRLGADPDDFGILERQSAPEQIAEVFLEMED